MSATPDPFHKEKKSSEKKQVCAAADIVLMDFDGTLTPLNCIDQLCFIRKRLMKPWSYFLWVVLMYIKAPLFLYYHKTDPKKFNVVFYKHYAGLNETRVIEIIRRDLSGFLRDRLFYSARRAVNEHRSESSRLVLVSAGYMEIVRVASSLLGIRDVIATELEVREGVFTGNVLGKAVDGEEKAHRAKIVIDSLPLGSPRVVVYGNSQWDIPMAKLGSVCHFVNVSARLKKKVVAAGLNVCFHVWRLDNNAFPVMRTVLRVLTELFLSEREGIKNIPKDRPLILVANHNSYLDHYLIGATVAHATRRKIHFMAKQEHFSSPVSNRFHRFLGGFPVNRNSGVGGIKKALGILKNGGVVLVYPEGTRSLDGRMGEFKPGVLYLQEKTGAVLLPVGLKNTFRILPKGKRLPRIKRICKMRVGPPVNFLASDRKARLEELKAIISSLER